jgi:integrase
MRRTAQQSGLEVIELERLRHSFITWAVAGGTLVQPKDGGIPIASIAELVGHKTQRTTRRFYLGTFIPPMAKLTLRLEHPEDPKSGPQFAVVAG